MLVLKILWLLFFLINISSMFIWIGRISGSHHFTSRNRRGGHKFQQFPLEAPFTIRKTCFLEGLNNQKAIKSEKWFPKDYYSSFFEILFISIFEKVFSKNFKFLRALRVFNLWKPYLKTIAKIAKSKPISFLLKTGNLFFEHWNSWIS